jgi:RNA polymerase sigma-70 factor, ECF subfamily
MVKEFQKKELFSQIYQDFADRIYNFLFSMMKNRDIALELSQDVFLRIFQNMDRYDDAKGKWSTWIYAIARNLAYNYIKHQKYEPGVSLNKPISIGKDEAELIDLIADSKEIGPEKQLELKELKDTVNQAIGLLSVRYREVIVLCDIHNMPYNHVASLIKCSKNAVAIRLMRARKNLAEIIEAGSKQKRIL